MIRREHASLELVRRESVLPDELSRVRDDLLRRLFSTVAGLLVAISEEQVRGERHVVAQRAAEQIARADAQLLTDDIDARELDRRVKLRAVVVQRRRWIADLPIQLLELKWIVTDQIRFQSAKRRLGAFPAAAHLTQARDPLVSLDFDDRPNEPSPVAAVCMTQRGLQGHGHRGRLDIDDFHRLLPPMLKPSPPSTRIGWPVIKLALSLARKSISSAIS